MMKRSKIQKPVSILLGLLIVLSMFAGLSLSALAADHVHHLVDHAAQSPTCTDIGWAAYQTCTDCDYSTFVELPATGHSYGTKGELRYTCLNCRFVNSALEDADLFLLVTEIGETFKNQEVLAKIIRSNTPVILVINKIDLSNQQTIQDKIAYWQNQIPRAIIVPASATERFNIDTIFDHIIEQLPENPPYFPKDELTDRSMRFFVSEIIREKLLLYYQKEIPYSCEVAVESYKEKDGIDNISAIIFVERESQRAILIGHKGMSIKKVGVEARKDIEEFTGKKCFLNLYVKVLKDWRNSDRALRQFGYESD